MLEELSGAHLEMMRGILTTVPFAKLLGIELVAASKGSATLRFVIRPELTQNYGLMHGGAMASLISSR